MTKWTPEFKRRYNREYSVANKEAIRKQRQKFYKENRELLLERSRRFAELHPEKVRETFRRYREKNLTKDRIRCAQYKRRNRAKIRKWQANHLRTNVNFRLSAYLGNRIRMALKNRVKKSAKTIELVGCTIDLLKEHIERHFLPGMTWDNYGFRGWHVDHIRPCCSFDLSKPDQQRECFHYSNLRPLWWKDNLSKGGKIPQ